ncbi:MAG: RelA/SpoT family protein [Candidatus Peregrinibacteria bacterium]|nr:RelA/SpoT family protein [Candidatus Peregrinibacteria bacterium]
MSYLEPLLAKIEQSGLKVDAALLRAADQFVSTCRGARAERGYRILNGLLNIRPDDVTLVSGLIFSSRISIEEHALEIEKLFGPGVLKILQALSKIKHLRPDFERNDTEVLRQVILMVAEDLRVMFVCLADILDDVQHIEDVPVDNRKRLTEEALKIYAPVASRLGMYSLKWQLEDLAFKALNPFQYNHIQQQLEKVGEERKGALDEFQRELKEFLAQHDVACRVTGRTKSIYSIYRKMRKKSTDLILDLHDIFAVRVILPTKYAKDSTATESMETLYSVLGLIHNKCTPLPGRFKDYIAVPKPNGYQSLHTSILTTSTGLKNQPVEIQIRSEKMHREAEYGIAAHWLYEDTRGRSTVFDKEDILTFVDSSSDKDGEVQNKKLKRQIEWLRGLIKVQEDDVAEGEEVRLDNDLHEYKIDIFQDRIFVFTPNGEVKDLPVGSTPIDFAYSVHTDIGHRCAMAKVNGHIAPANASLKNGDVVEVILKPKPNPRPEWLSFVKTNSAKQKIKVWFKSQNRELSFREGKELLNKQLRRLNKAGLDDQLSVLKIYGGKTLTVNERQKIVEDIGNGSTPVNSVIKKMFNQDELMQPLIPVPLKEIPVSAPLDSRILLGGEAGLPVQLAQCCSPKEGESIVGYVSREHASIHKIDCAHLQSSNPARVLEARWVSSLPTGAQKYSVRILVEAVNRIGLIRDITGVVADMNVNILDFSVKHHDEKYVVRSLLLEVNGYEQLDDILSQLENITGILSVMREETREHQGISAKKKSAHSKAS